MSFAVVVSDTGPRRASIALGSGPEVGRARAQRPRARGRVGGMCGASQRRTSESRSALGREHVRAPPLARGAPASRSLACGAPVRNVRHALQRRAPIRRVPPRSAPICRAQPRSAPIRPTLPWAPGRRGVSGSPDGLFCPGTLHPPNSHSSSSPSKGSAICWKGLIPTGGLPFFSSMSRSLSTSDSMTSRLS